MAVNKERVVVLPWPGIEGAYLAVSGKRRRDEPYGEKFYAGHVEHTKTWEERRVRSEPFITFGFNSGTVCAEWDGNSGPIQLYFKREEGWKEGWDEAKPHWVFPFASGSGSWSQMAVGEAGLPDAFVSGNYARIFGELRQWAQSREPDAEQAA